MTAKKEDPVCLTPDCGKPAKWKGLCGSCYGAAKKLIDSEETTWDELSRLGLADIPALVFYKAFKERKKNAQVNQETHEEETPPARGEEWFDREKAERSPPEAVPED